MNKVKLNESAAIKMLNALSEIKSLEKFFMFDNDSNFLE